MRRALLGIQHGGVIPAAFVCALSALGPSQVSQAQVAANQRCAAAGSGSGCIDPAGVSSDRAALYVYRKYHFSGVASSPEVKLDGKVIGHIANDACVYALVYPGKHTIGTGTSSSAGQSVDVDFVGGKV